MLMPAQRVRKSVKLDMKGSPRRRDPYREWKDLGHPQGGLFPAVQWAARPGRDEARFASFPND